MNTITIPPEALKAGADLTLSSGFRLHPDEARAVFLAMLRSWPGMTTSAWASPAPNAIILPLPREPNDDK
jgi:hypothetical protein